MQNDSTSTYFDSECRVRLFVVHFLDGAELAATKQIANYQIVKTNDKLFGLAIFFFDHFGASAQLGTISG